MSQIPRARDVPAKGLEKMRPRPRNQAGAKVVLPQGVKQEVGGGVSFSVVANEARLKISIC